MMQPNIENTLMTLMGNDPRFQRAVAMLKGKTPEQRQQVIMNTIATQGIPQTQLAPLVSGIKQKLSMFGIQL